MIRKKYLIKTILIIISCSNFSFSQTIYKDSLTIKFYSTSSYDSVVVTLEDASSIKKNVKTLIFNDNQLNECKFLTDFRILKGSCLLFKDSIEYMYELKNLTNTNQVKIDLSNSNNPSINSIKQNASEMTAPGQSKINKSQKNTLKNPLVSFSSSLIYSASSNIKNDYLFPGLNIDAEVIYSIPWSSDSLGFGFKTGLSLLKFDDNYFISKLTFLDLQILFLVSWGKLYNCPIKFQPYIGYTLFFGKSINDKIFFSYGGRINFRLPSLGKFSLLIDGQMINTKFKDSLFGGTLGIIYLGVNYRL